MKVWYCPHCNEYLGVGKKVIRHRKDCEKKTAGMVELDADMAPIIKTLNQHGYKTIYSCIGHAYDNYTSSYILFDKVYNDVKQAAMISGLKYGENMAFRWKDTGEIEYMVTNEEKVDDISDWLSEKVDMSNITCSKICAVRCNIDGDMYSSFNLDSVKRHRDILDKYIKFTELLSMKYNIDEN